MRDLHIPSLWTSVGFTYMPSTSIGYIILRKDNSFLLLMDEKKGQKMPLFMLEVPV